jgi:hypothetical protein
VAVYKEPDDAEEDEGDDESVAEETGWFSDVAAKRISDMESSGIAADDGGCANWICEELSTDGSGLHRVHSLTGERFEKRII